MHLKHFPFRHLRIPKEYTTLPRSIKIAFFIFLIYYLGWGIVMAYYSIYLKKILGNYSSVGYVFAMYHTASLIVSLLLGILLDKVNKQKIIRFILLFYFPFSYIFLKIRNLSQFLAFKIYHGTIATSLWVSVEAYIRKHSPKKRTIESIALFDLGPTLALVIGGFLGAFLITLYSFNIFYAISLFAFLAFLIAIFLPDHEKTNFNINLLKGIKKEFIDFKKNIKLRKLSLALFLYILAMGTIPMILPLFLRHIGATLWQIGIIFAISNIPFLFEGVFALFKERKRTLISAIFIGIVIFTFLFFIRNILLIFIISFLISICFSAITPIISGKLTETMPKTKRGELSGMLSAIRNIGFILSTLAAGFISDALGLNFVFAFDAIILLLLLFVVSRIEFE